ncbi:hypothetical protein Tco_0784362 [Tanacetum coccineum]
MIRRRHGKTPYELLHDKPPDLSYLHVFGALCYPTNDSENLGKLQPKADIEIIETIHVDFDELTAMASEHSSSGPALHDMTPVTISSGLVPNPPPSTPFVPPSRSEWDLLFQPMFDESLNPPPYVDLQAPEVIAPIPEVVAPEHAVSTGSPSSTTVDQDAPSPSNSHTTQETQTPIISHDVEEDNHDIEVVTYVNDPVLCAATWDDHTINGGTLVLLVYLVNAAKVNSWNVSTYNSTNLVLGWDKDSIKLKKVVFGFIEDVITKTIDYHLFDVVVEFHRSKLLICSLLDEDKKGKIVGIYRFDETKEQKNETRRTNSALWDSRRLKVKQ